MTRDPRADALEAQQRAANPTNSTWLGANAGSGKTRVLTDRVARLLLIGVDPQHILCLTYTKAAASEMQNRLFQRLGAWSMLRDDDLRDELLGLGEAPGLTTSALRMARTLFARAVETPGGLKIQTIHSFCASILRRFSLEAGVSPKFREMEEREAELLRLEILEQMAVGKDAEALRSVTHYLDELNLKDLAAEIASSKPRFQTQRNWAEVAAKFHAREKLDDPTLEKLLFDGSERALIDKIVPILTAGSVTDRKLGNALSRMTDFDASALPVLQSAFLTAQHSIKKNVPTKATQAALGDNLETLFGLVGRVETTTEEHLKHRAAAKTYALDQFAHRFLDHYANAKRLRGLLDFDDLIARTNALLMDPSVATWVLYRLDGGISHILVDEAQDTSPIQWDVIRKLAQEITGGYDPDSTKPRTIFVVGDKKQSIYSFQGADPAQFDRMMERFDNALSQGKRSLEKQSLRSSFRSSNAILNAVDATFQKIGDSEIFDDKDHFAFHSEKPGRVDLWPVIEKSIDKEDRHWTDPVDRRTPTHHTVRLAQQIADQIAEFLDPNKGFSLPDVKKPHGGYADRQIEPRDIMVLVQRRSGLFHQIIQACKARMLPIAGTDRLRVTAELAVRDVLALLSVLVTPDDDLSLAAALKSPLFGWTEKNIFDLAHYRGKQTLWQALSAHKTPPSDAYEILIELRREVDFLRPFEVIERILTRFHGREKLMARLGAEAEDGIDALLSQALS